jgi:hypothetical protein
MAEIQVQSFAVPVRGPQSCTLVQYICKATFAIRVKSKSVRYDLTVLATNKDNC